MSLMFHSKIAIILSVWGTDDKHIEDTSSVHLAFLNWHIENSKRLWLAMRHLRISAMILTLLYWKYNPFFGKHKVTLNVPFCKLILKQTELIWKGPFTLCLSLLQPNLQQKHFTLTIGLTFAMNYMKRKWNFVQRISMLCCVCVLSFFIQNISFSNRKGVVVHNFRYCFFRFISILLSVSSFQYYTIL